MERSFVLKEEYLYIPVSLGNEGQYLEISEGVHGENKIFEFFVPAGDNFDYTAKVFAGDYVGKTLKLSGGFSEEFFQAIIEGREVRVPNEVRPSLHFTATYGWINDPNGLIYDGKLFHLYFQHNPFDVKWQNMSWGHATSTDLLHWTNHGDVMFPDERGTIFSGCGLIHQGKYLFPYTVAGTSSPWSDGKPFYQGLAISEDGGMTLKKQDEPFLGITGKDSRDPKIFWHDESDSFVMVLYLEKNDFAIYRSKDLKDWKETQRFTIEDAWECPDLLRLPICSADKATNGEKWMFWSADGFYYWGTFDGYCFTSDWKRHNAFIGNHYYATQTYWGIKDRIVAVHWLRFEEPMGKYYQGAMAIPREYKCCPDGEDYRLLQFPVQEFMERLQEEETVPDQGCYVIDMEAASDGLYEFEVNGSSLTLDFTSHEIRVDAESQKIPESIKMIQMIVDYNLFEISFNNAIIGVFEIKGEQNSFQLVRRDYGNIERCGSGNGADCHYCIKSIK